MDLTSNKRAINRHNWDYDELTSLLNSQETIHHKVFAKLKNIIRTRKNQKAFHPNATQFTLHFEQSLFAFWRQSQDRTQSIFCIYNVTDTTQTVALKALRRFQPDGYSLRQVFP